MQNVVPLPQRPTKKKSSYSLNAPPPDMQRLELKLVVLDSFNQSEETLYEKHRHKLNRPLKPHECILFISLTETMILFVWGKQEFKNETDTTGTRIVLPSQKRRITIGPIWNPVAIQEYAEMCNIELINFDLQAFTKAYFRTR